MVASAAVTRTTVELLRGVRASRTAQNRIAAIAKLTAPRMAAADIALSDEEKTYLEELYRPRDMINDYNPTRRPRALGA